MFGAREPKITKDDPNDRVHGTQTASGLYFIGNLNRPRPLRYERLGAHLTAKPQKLLVNERFKLAWHRNRIFSIYTLLFNLIGDDNHEIDHKVYSSDSVESFYF